MDLFISPIKLSNLTVAIDIIEDVPTLFFEGALDQQNPKSFLEEFLIELDEKLVQNSAKQILVNIEKLIFLNSSGIKEIVKWILAVKNRKKKERYHITFVCSSKTPWQAESIGKLKLLDPKILEVTIK